MSSGCRAWIRTMTNRVKVCWPTLADSAFKFFNLSSVICNFTSELVFPEVVATSSTFAQGYGRTSFCLSFSRPPQLQRRRGIPGGSCNLTKTRLKVGCRSPVASGMKMVWCSQLDLHQHSIGFKPIASTLGYTSTWNGGAHGEICTHTCDALDVVPLHWATRALIMAAVTGLAPANTCLKDRALELTSRSRLKEIEWPASRSFGEGWSACWVTLPDPALVQCDSVYKTDGSL